MTTLGERVLAGERMKLAYPPEFFRPLDCGRSGSGTGCYALLAYLASVATKRHFRILEIGTHNGVGTTALALGAPGCIVDTVDYVDNPGDRNAKERHWRENGVRDRIVFHVGDSREVLPRLPGRFDLALIDASHDWAIKTEDYRNVRDRATLIVIDDCAWEAPYWTEAMADPRWRTLPTVPQVIGGLADWRGVKAAVNECFPGGRTGAWQNGVEINPGVSPKFGTLVLASEFNREAAV